MPDAPSFPARLRALRERAGLSVDELAARAGLARAAVYKVEAGSDPKWTTVLKLAEALGVTPDAFTRGGD